MKVLIDYIESLEITQGRRAGERVELMPWERRFLRGAFASGSAQSELLAHGCILRQGHDQSPHEVGDFRVLLLVGATVGVTAQQQSRVAWVSY